LDFSIPTIPTITLTSPARFGPLTNRASSANCWFHAGRCQAALTSRAASSSPNKALILGLSKAAGKRNRFRSLMRSLRCKRRLYSLCDPVLKPGDGARPGLDRSHLSLSSVISTEPSANSAMLWRMSASRADNPFGVQLHRQQRCPAGERQRPHPTAEMPESAPRAIQLPSRLMAAAGSGAKQRLAIVAGQAMVGGARP